MWFKKYLGCFTESCVVFIVYLVIKWSLVRAQSQTSLRGLYNLLIQSCIIFIEQCGDRKYGRVTDVQQWPPAGFQLVLLLPLKSVELHKTAQICDIGGKRRQKQSSISYTIFPKIALDIKPVLWLIFYFLKKTHWASSTTAETQTKARSCSWSGDQGSRL